MRFRGGSGGQSMVEMALIAPILIMILISVLDFGRAAYIYSTLSGAVRDGARTAVLTGSAQPTNALVTGAVEQYAIGLQISGAACANGPITDPGSPAPNTGLVWVTAPSGSGSTAPNAPRGQPAAVAAGGCSAVNPGASGRFPLTVTVHYYFSPLTPFGSQFFNQGIVMSFTSTMTTEY